MSLEPSVSDSTHPLRLNYLDGVRGLAALYVVLFHAHNDAQAIIRRADPMAVPFWLKGILLLLSQGHVSVAVFIVLSGYCLMLPIARSNGRLQKNWLDFFKRRGRRILPPYYAALLLSLLLTAMIPTDRMVDAGGWGFSQPSFTPGTIISHILLLHNLRPEWFYKIDYSMWSVALEWQIYFLFPTLLIPMWRWLGIPAVLIMASLLALILCHSIPYAWYIFLFTLGMVGASINFSRDRSFLQVRHQFWGQCSIAAFLSALIVTLVFLIEHQTVQVSDQNVQCFVDLLTGLGTVCLLIYCTQALTERKAAFSALAFFENSFLVKVGTFSYSLYLIHALVIAVLQLGLSTLHPSPTVRILTLMITVLPLAMPVSYGFYLMFERRFTSTPQPAKAVT